MVRIFGLCILTSREMRDMDAEYIAMRQARDAARHRASVMRGKADELRAELEKRRENEKRLAKTVDRQALLLKNAYGCALKARTAEAGRAVIDAADDVPEGCVHAFVPGKSGTQEGGAQA